MVYQTKFQDLKLFKKGKVRDVYEVDDFLLIVATDRISCFDVVLPTPIPDKGKILTEISTFWFSFFKDSIENHIVSTDAEKLPPSLDKYKKDIEGRFMFVKKCKVISFECVVRGYIAGSGWKDYKKNQSICGIPLPAGLKQADKLPESIFTPATKAETGHDENVDFNYMKKHVGQEMSEKLKDISISLYKRAAEYAEKRGIIIADTKFEFGLVDGKPILIDEILTPDSSRFWPRQEYAPGSSPSSFDKQYVRDYLDSLDWAKTYPAPELPPDVVKKTREKYNKALDIITG